MKITDPTFAADYWRKEATILENDGWDPPVASLSETLSRYRQAAARADQGQKYAECVTVIDGNRCNPVNLDLIFDPERDASIDDYILRVEDRMQGKYWNSAYFGLPSISADFWDFSKSFADYVSRALGIRPGGRVDVDCFVGRYQSTHTGVHVDHADNFAFTFREGKTMLTWPGHQQEVEGVKWPSYEPYRKSATALVNSFGKIAYFPEDAYHVAESAENVSVNMNLAFWLENTETRKLVEMINTSLSREGVKDTVAGGNGRVSLCGKDQANLDRISALAIDGRIERWMAESTLRRESSGRLGVGRPIESRAPVATRMSLNSNAGLNWYSQKSSEWMMVGGNGHVVELPYHSALVEFLEGIRAGEVVEPGDWASGDLRGRLLAALTKWGVTMEANS